jgi:hypothetical protein
MNRYLDFFLIALVVGLAFALAYNVHKYGLQPTLEAIKKFLGVAEKAVVTDTEAVLARVEQLFAHYTANTAIAVAAAVKSATPPVAPAVPQQPPAIIKLSVSTPVGSNVTGAPVAGPVLPPVYLLAEANARPELDRPDHVSLAALLAMPVEAAGRLVATTSDAVNLNLREALIRAARILDPNTYVPISMYNPAAIAAGIASACPVMRRFSASQLFIATIGDRADGSVGPMPTIDFSRLAPDGDVIYVPYDAASKANVTLESVAKAEAQPAAGA